MKFILTVCLLFAFNYQHALAGAPTEEPSTENYDDIVAQYVESDTPGVAVIVSKDGEVLYQSARGMANIELNVPLTTDSVFRLGSITKQFTAAAIMQLQEKGKLSIKDDIHKYIAEFPTEGHVVTIEHLLTHTSGLANYTEDLKIFASEIQLPVTTDEMVTRFAKHPMVFKTGDKMRYSNTGYVLLGKIIEKVSGTTYADYINNNIFKPLKMNGSYYGGSEIIPNRVSGYGKGPYGIYNAMYINMGWPHAAGSLLSTVGDLNIWNHALANGKLISTQSYQKMISPFTLNDGTLSQYGFGLGIIKLADLEAISHSGGIPGFNTNAIYFPENGIYVAVLNNTDNGISGSLSVRLAAEALGVKVPKFEAQPINESKLKPFIGRYKINDNSYRVLSLEHGKVYTQRDGGQKSEVFALSDNTFFYQKSMVYFTLEQNQDGEKTMNMFYDLATTPQVATKEK